MTSQASRTCPRVREHGTRRLGFIAAVADFEAEVAGNEAGFAGVAEVVVNPAEHDEEFVAEADEEGDVDDGPGEPGEGAAEFQAFDVGDSAFGADGGHDSFVAITEGGAMGE